MFTAHRILLLLIWSFLPVLPACAAGSVAGPAAAAAGLKVSLGELQALINKTIASVDIVTANKLEAADARIRALIPELERIERGAVTDANDALSDLTRETNQIALDIRKTISSTENSAFGQLNQSLAVLSQVLAGLPFVDIDPYVAAIEPSRVFAAGTERRLTIYGHLPGDPKDDIVITVGGFATRATRTKAFGLVVEIPKEVQLVETRYVPVSIKVKTPMGPFGWFSKTIEISDRVYVARAEPYQCRVRWMQNNPDYLAQIKAAAPFSDEATTQSNAARSTVNRTVTARDLFVATVASAADSYDLSTVRIKDPGASFAHYGDCDHYRTRGRITTWNPDNVSFELYAPEVGRHLHSGWSMQRIGFIRTRLPYSYYVDAGGTKSTISLAPLFEAAKKGVQPLAETHSEQLKMGWRTVERDVRKAQTGDWSIHVNCDFEDGRERWSSGELVLRAIDPQELGRGVLARVADGQLYLQPLTLGEQPANEHDKEGLAASTTP